ncbi:MAG TPA: phage integrase SAM-like domain-containing protein [Spirochaetota bacterium]|nr:phage integrase SAM-like domain-containing protein [Spirochaetota bacterium]HRS79386.1 phage integrase SAM-like domain-containing protein [Spirochaetota bacterium]HRT77344.1 phage integrase SAM-like domain-containing protein [Spirochaetota bacterium]
MPFSEHKNQNRTHGRTRYRFYLQHNKKKHRNTVVVHRTAVEKVYHEWVESIMDGSIENRDRKLFEIIDQYLTYITERKPQKYVKSHRKELALFRQFIRDTKGDIEVNEIKRFHVKDFKDWRRQHTLVTHKREVSSRAVNYSVSVLSVFFNWCIDREIYNRSNPASRCKDPEDNCRLVLWNPDYTNELFSKARERREWLLTGVMLAISAGLRRK